MRAFAHSFNRRCLLVASASILCKAPEPVRATEKTPDCYVLDEKRATLKQLHVLFRHGARTPLSDKSQLWTGTQWDVCGNAYQPISWDARTEGGEPRPPNAHDARQVSDVLFDGQNGCHKGQLTLMGQIQALSLGQWLRQRYVEDFAFLPRDYQPNALHSRSTNFQRTLATLAGVLTGLYPPTAAAAGASQPVVPVVVCAEVDEVLYADTASCPHFHTFFKTARALAKDASLRDPEHDWALQRVRAALESKLGTEYFDSGRWHWVDFNDVFTTLRTHGKPLAAGVDSHLLKVVERLATAEWVNFVAPAMDDGYSRDVLRLSMGRIIDAIAEQLQQHQGAADDTSTSPSSSNDGASSSTAQGTTAAGGSEAASSPTQPRLYLLSGHDSSLMPLLTMFGSPPTDQWPPYCSSLVIELWELASDVPDGERDSSSTQALGRGPLVVRVLYNQQELQLPGCAAGTAPSLATFRARFLDPYRISASEHHDRCFASAEEVAAPAVSLASPQEDD